MIYDVVSRYASFKYKCVSLGKRAEDMTAGKVLVCKNED